MTVPIYEEKAGQRSRATRRSAWLREEKLTRTEPFAGHENTYNTGREEQHRTRLRSGADYRTLNRGLSNGVAHGRRLKAEAGLEHLIGRHATDGDARERLRLRAGPEDDRARFQGLRAGAAPHLDDVLRLEGSPSREQGDLVLSEEELDTLGHAVGDLAASLNRLRIARLEAGEARNCEPDKAGDVRWFAMDELPENLTMTARNAIRSYVRQTQLART